MSERTLDDRLFDALHRLYAEPVSAGPIAEDVRLAISTALTLARREGYRLALEDTATGIRPLTRDKAVCVAYPLPTRTVRKPREPERDPHGSLNDAGDVITYTVDDGLIMAKHNAHRHSTSLPPATQSRVALWFNMMMRPYHEESVPVDPAEVLP